MSGDEYDGHDIGLFLWYFTMLVYPLCAPYWISLSIDICSVFWTFAVMLMFRLELSMDVCLMVVGAEP